MPKTNIEFWQNKLAANVRRDKSNQDDLSMLGWRAFVVWECDIKKDLSSVIKQLVDHIREEVETEGSNG